MHIKILTKSKAQFKFWQKINQTRLKIVKY